MDIIPLYSPLPHLEKIRAFGTYEADRSWNERECGGGNHERATKIQPWGTMRGIGLRVRSFTPPLLFVRYIQYNTLTVLASTFVYILVFPSKFIVTLLRKRYTCT